MPQPFTTTGFHKSGTVWFEHMVFALPGVTGPCGGRGVVPKAHLSVFLGDPQLRALCERSGTTPGRAAARLMGAADGPSPFETADEPAVRRAVESCLRRLTPWAPFDTVTGSGMPDADAMVRVLRGEQTVEAGLAAGTPSKHIPVERLRREAPSFRVLQLLRDPRDVIVSHIHHDLRGLAPRVFELYAREGAGGSFEWRTDWRERVAELRAREMLGYFGPEADETTRYEALLDDPRRALGRVAQWLGIDDDAGVRAAVERYDRDAVRQNAAIRRPNHVRRARAGEWERQLDRPLIDALGPAFVELVGALGYEPDDAWVGRMPDVAPVPFDSGAFTPELCVCNRFRDRWAASEELQARFPDPNASDRGFYEWLRAEGGDDVLAFDTAARALAERPLACA